MEVEAAAGAYPSSGYAEGGGPPANQGAAKFTASVRDEQRLVWSDWILRLRRSLLSRVLLLLFSLPVFSSTPCGSSLSLSISLDPLHLRHASAGCEIVQRNAPFLRSEARVAPEDTVPKQTAADRTCSQQSKHERTAGVQTPTAKT